MPDDRLRFTGTTALLAIAFAVSFSSVAARAESPADVEDFEKHVRPLLVEHCQSCHGPEKQKGGLRLDSRPMMVEGGDTGPALEPGKPDESLLIRAVRQTGDLKMPPKKALSKEQVAVLERWIAAGAPWPQASTPAAATRKEIWARHWAFQPVADPKPPAVGSDWGRNPIDAFIKAKLDAAGLSPSPAADRPTLIRRASYDLTGLPPTVEEVAAFVADPDPDAFAKLVDRLLASKAYGEQWARHWLDVARYSDTKGYVYGREERFFVQSAAYRDWVVNAFNKDLPYNRFLLDQIAADQADPDDPSALAAMGFLTLGRRFLGVTPDVIDDRIDVVTRGTMGMTVGCARCHDHKFDPIPTADYYSLYGVFVNCTERLVPLAEPAVKDEAFEKELKKRRDALRDGTAASREEASKRVRGRVAEYLLVQQDLSSVPAEGFDTVLYEKDLIPGFVRRWNAYLDKLAKADDPIFRPWRRFAALAPAEFAAKSAEVTRDLARDGAPPLNPLVASAFSTPPSTIREAAERYGKLFAEVDRLWGEARKAKPDAATLPEPAVEALRRVLYAPDESPCYVPDEPIVTTEWFFDSANVVKLWTLQGEVDRWLINSPQAPPHAVAVVDRAELREPRIFKRGSSANLGDEVPRRFLQVVAGPDRKPFANGSGRLELAKAIVDPDNPLTARVWVNRLWTHHFGAGLVRTPSDFGIRSEPPSHPELLDWLARRLVSEGWSTKAIHRLILLSSAYQQRSNGPDDLAARARSEDKDPENRLLWRMNPHRLSFEEARDSVLAVSGELDPRMGGRAVDLFAAPNVRRTLYGLVDRQFLPGVLRVFDFANPDLHIPTRSETTVPQQALFAMNHAFFADRARTLAARLPSDDPDAAVGFLYRSIYQRDPTPDQARAAREFVASAAAESAPIAPPATLAWSYGYGPVDPKSGPSKVFKPLPHYDGKGWGGGPQWPDPTLGWARITAEGGHPGDDLARSTFRRWTAPIRGEVAVDSTLVHDVAGGDGVRAWVVSSRHGVLKTAVVHNAKVDFHVAKVAVEPGDTIDFVVDIRDGLNSDQHLWSPKIRLVAPADVKATSETSEWDASRDFTGPPTRQLKPWEQLAQVLLMSNEFLFVD
ncbi:MAG: PSD1 and planctomycete cytochrome C domain-containing protein [Paludisphaera borealis]|uniref:PSD1 and planctomycete cytochrome C domain-containing protein n=1 Tax=Paludisphaera borealis TaxID=1387353 RepID=UPI002850E6E8|nr:PSD1 and planctomycete cytochrome C domain-containing protein [Paludisphaera borealis]MDR3622251.1 PSD1 and planctomycete cytochrome C domain-containing protein [Paludisphaera borealis]